MNQDFLDKLFHGLFVCEEVDYLEPPITLRIKTHANGSEFYQEFSNPSIVIPEELNGNTVQEFVDIFIDKLGEDIIRVYQE